MHCLKSLVWISFGLIIIFNVSCSRNGIDIYSYILRDRVIVTDRVLLKKALYIAFSVDTGPTVLSSMLVHGQLLCDGKILSESSIKAFRAKNGDLVFDLPYEIPDGLYTIKIDALNDKRELITTGARTVQREELKSTFHSQDRTSVSAAEEIPDYREPEHFQPSGKDIQSGYIIFHRYPFEYAGQGSSPKESEIINNVSIRVVRNEFEPITFLLYPLHDLGNVKLTLSNLRSGKNTISKNRIKVGYVESVQETIGLPEGKFRNIPALIKAGNQIDIKKGQTQRFWLTIRIDENVSPGKYKGTITISPQNGAITYLPLTVDVTPISLEEIPAIDYFMLMTYEFTELSMPWNREEKDKIYKSACNVLRDYREHGMTMLCIHSPFVLKTNDDGTPNLEDIYATLRAARDVGFRRPIIWYMGHLIHTAKPKHPGSIIGFDQKVDLPRLKYLVHAVTEYARQNNCPEVIFLPIDEPDDTYQDYKNRRRDITSLLLQTIKESGAKTMLTARNYSQFKPVDYLCSGELNQKELHLAHDNGAVYWIYNNEVSTKCDNPAYARYIYGYYTWRNHIDGMSTWTFQNTQNASGLPTKADGSGNDLYIAYPSPGGPLPTLKWEAIREGIDDHKLIYQLTKRIAKLKKNGIDISKYERFLSALQQKKSEAACSSEDSSGWSPIFFQTSRDDLISMILDADRRGTSAQRVSYD